MIYVFITFGFFLMYMIGFFMGNRSDITFDEAQMLRREGWKACEEWVAENYETEEFREYIKRVKNGQYFTK